ncbi:protein FAM169B isoform X3 [Thamnophis elegans]|uniref:protein FAM169B isoform X3 n=1 Tax=Thamnophis elegans TaxID=35005 RepID=UPI00137668AC|nr:protein FAM169B isoform X3 [Thamnophis elegans]
MAGGSRLHPGRGGADSLFLVDIKDENLENLETGLCNNQAKRMEEALSATEDLSVPGQKNIKVEASSMSFLPLCRDDSECCLLVLTDPQDKNKVLAIYLNNSWRLPEDVMKTSDPFRKGLKQVQTFQERIVLYVLNCIIFGMLERSSTDDTVFVPHPKKEDARIFWKSGEAAAFYTIKRRVCQKFLETYPKEQSRLWEVEAPGDWTQRVNIWLKIQLEQSLPKMSLPDADRSSPMPKDQDDEVEEGRINTSLGCIPHLGALPDKPMAHLGDRRGAPDLPSQSNELQVELKAEEPKKLKKRTSREEPAGEGVAKHLRTTS